MVFLLAFSLFTNGAGAAADLRNSGSAASVLVIYSAENAEISPDQRLMDMHLGHFTEYITFKSVLEVTEGDLGEKTHLIYYGETNDAISGKVVDILDAFDGPTMAIGNNVEKLGEKFDYLETGGEEVVTKLDMPGQEDKEREIEPNLLFATEVEEDTSTIVEAEGDNGTFPLISENDGNYYVASDKLVPPYSVYFTQALHNFFDTEPVDTTPGYLRLEDVHPLADADRLMDIAELLKEREIPYMIAVVPVYTNPETGRRYHFNDAPEVLEALKYMQDNGGSVVLHGYTHQFRTTETGEGFEFWDVENDMPVYHGPDDEPRNKSASSFATNEDYQAYMIENKRFESDYVRQRLTRGVQELSNFGLYPLAFEAPHYTMSQNGYRVASEHFSTYVGQVQLSDEYWEAMDTTPNVSKPTLLNGMTLLPETIGYVQPGDNQAVEKMMARAEEYQISDGGMIGGFYHPYLGVEGLEDLLDEMETIPDLEWLDMKEMRNTVEVENITIKSGNGRIETDIDTAGLMTSSIDFPVYHIKNFIDKVTWVVAGIGVTAVIMFIFYTVFRRPRREHEKGEKKIG